MKKAITYANTRRKDMRKLNLENTYLIVKTYTLLDETKITIDSIYENVLEEDIKELEKIVDDLNRKENGHKDFYFQITDWFYLKKLSDFKIEYIVN